MNTNLRTIENMAISASTINYKGNFYTILSCDWLSDDEMPEDIGIYVVDVDNDEELHIKYSEVDLDRDTFYTLRSMDVADYMVIGE